MREEWKVVDGYPGYHISNYGRVYSNKLKKILTAPSSNDKNGYCRIGLWLDQKKKLMFVHRLVALHFIPNPENKPTVNHKDKNIHNNYVSNLEWATVAEQTAHQRLTYHGTKGIHTKPITLIKDDIEYHFDQTRETIDFLKCSWTSWKRLTDGLKQDINGFKIKKI